jgi:hypothetical protein
MTVASTIDAAGWLGKYLEADDADVDLPRAMLQAFAEALMSAQVRYEVLDSAAAALAREADILAALRPPWNRAHVDDYFSYVTITDKGLALGAAGTYGCFPHLGKGALSEPGRACIDGFDALSRIVKTTSPERRLVHDFLTGRSDRLLRAALEIDQPHIAHGVRRDRLVAKGFYDAGPRAIRTLRLRHGGAGRVTQDQFAAWITEEVRAVLAAGPENLPGSTSELDTVPLARRIGQGTGASSARRRPERKLLKATVVR